MKTLRHSKILEIIKEKDVETQEDILLALRNCGFDVTQATVSRDIKELRLIKSLSTDGKYHYSTNVKNKAEFSNNFQSIFSGSVISVDFTGNLIVVKTHAGMAQAVCAAFDSIEPEGVVGTLAGDDTIFIAVRTNSRAISLTSELKKSL
ncbi:MAG: arginine repressor [Bacillota bacterium]|nr:arginine repressor [Bacillota bacterium]